MELNEKVRIITEDNELFGRTGKVSSIISDLQEKNIGVDIDWDCGDPKPYYFSENELELVTEESDEDDF
jgi:hypothetical protein